MNNTKKTIVLAVILAAGILMLFKGASYATDNKTSEEKESTIALPATIAPPPGKGITEAKRKIRNIKASSDQVLYFNVPVSGESVDIALSELEKMTKKYNDVYLMINSPGGSVFDGVRLTSYIEAHPKNIHTICVTLCASMAAHLFETGKTRLMLNGGIVMFHPASGGAQGQVENMLSMLGMIKAYVDKLDARAVARSKLNYQDFKAKVATEYWVSSDEALSTGLADEVVSLTTDDTEKPYGKDLDKTIVMTKKAGWVKSDTHSLTKLPDVRL